MHERTLLKVTIILLIFLIISAIGNVLFFIEYNSREVCSCNTTSDDTEEVEIVLKEMSYMDYSGVMLEGADLSDANAYKAVFQGTDLRNADLHGGIFSLADFTGADLTDADLVGAAFDYADLSGAVLIGADMRYADLRGADLSGADLTDALIEGTDLRWVTGNYTI
ncbi:pentapeptide repeat protein [Methanolacinia petrolearia DSM 11571]|uniref:Pentapeptide repeat protein n=1 Tax=Methanolacinia petrolearia (strain DSM 11571 / OCM 486 / SEBR 4847) TaxID=679926 RepID=E1RJ78_METP4|nr:pentapeptide repeat-containing protein [Methanolacinia petrolearia]ADN35596.1 pentapeptide repeat protein [Methanolacinia petrolearia DSM 11571]